LFSLLKSQMDLPGWYRLIPFAEFIFRVKQFMFGAIHRFP